MIEVIPVGGYNEVGKNMTAIKIDDEILILDMGLYLPAVLGYEEGDPRDLDTQQLIKIGAIPNDEILRKEKDKVKAIIISHCHLDHCLHPNTYVQLGNGEIETIENININSKVGAIYFKSLKYDPALCKRKEILNAPKDILEIKTKTKRVKATQNHKFFVLKDNFDIVEKKASELKEKDLIATCKKIAFEGKQQYFGNKSVVGVANKIEFPKKTSKELCQFLGYVLGDGNPTKKDRTEKHVYLRCTDKDIGNLKIYKKIGEKLFSIKGSIKPRSANKNSRNRLIFSSPLLTKFIDSISVDILNNSPKRKIPKILHKTSNKEVAGFLRGLYDAEGSVRNHSIVLTSTSENIIFVSQMLLLRFGIYSHIYQDSITSAGNKAYQLVIYYPKSIKKFYRTINFDSKIKKKDIKILIKKIGGGVGEGIELYPLNGFLGEMLKLFNWKRSDLVKRKFSYQHYLCGKHLISKDGLEKLFKIIKKESKKLRSDLKTSLNHNIKYIKNLINSDILFEPITKINKIKADCDKVIDITIPGHSNFIANGMIVHNSGAVPYLGFHYNCPIIGTPYTLEVLKNILEEHHSSLTKKFKKLNYNSSLKISDNIKLEFFPITHSTLQTVLVVIHTKYGNIIYANDFKLDNHPVLGQKPNYEKLKKLSDNCLLLIMDSLYSNLDAKTPSEKVAREMLKDVLVGVQNEGSAIIVTTFSSHIARLKSIVEFGRILKRKIVFLGRSLSNYVGSAQKLNLINFGKEVEIIGYRGDVKRKLVDIQKHGREKYLIVCTGNQGEPDAVLSRMARKDLPFEFLPNDIVIFSCRTIPTEMTIKNRDILEKKLKQKHVRIFTNIHTSGHASREDHRDMINLLKPKNIIPTHGDKKITKGLETLAEEMGYELGKNVHLLSDNKAIKIN